MLYTKYNTLLVESIFKESKYCKIGNMSYSKPCFHHSLKQYYYSFVTSQ